MKMNRREIIKTAVLAAVAPRVLAEAANDAHPPAVSAATEAVLSGLCVFDRTKGTVDSNGKVSQAVMRMCLLGADGHRPMLQFHAADLTNEADLHKFDKHGNIQYGVDEHGERVVRCDFKGWTLMFDGDSTATGQLEYSERPVPFDGNCPTTEQWKSLDFVAGLKAISNATATKGTSSRIAGVFWMSRGMLKGLPPAHPHGYKSYKYTDGEGTERTRLLTDRIQLTRVAGEKLTLKGWHNKDQNNLTTGPDFEWEFGPKNGGPLRLAIYSSPQEFEHHGHETHLRHFGKYYDVLEASPHKLLKREIRVGALCVSHELSIRTLSSGYCPPGKYP